jgi:glycerate dehydrogenase
MNQLKLMRHVERRPMKIVVLDGYTVDPGDNPWPSLEELGSLTIYDRTSPSQLYERATSAQVLVTNKTVLDHASLEQLPNLQFIAVTATGYNVVDVKTARTKGIAVSNVPAYGTDTVAQYVMALLLELCHHVGEHAESVARGEWQKSPDWTYWKHPQVELNGLCLGIVGFGRIGRRVAELGRAFGMRVLYASRSSQIGVAVDAQQVPLETLFREADVVSLHCSLDDKNAGFVNRSLLQRMKPSAFLINTARGPLINEADLASALRQGLLAGAALDVLSSEPPISDNPLLHVPRCLITPHMAWASHAARRRIVHTTVENIRAFASGSPINVVNPTI